MKNKKRIFGLTIGLTLMSSLALSACSDGESSESSGKGEAGGVSGEILLYDTSGGQVVEVLKKTLAKDFEEETGVSVVDDYNEAATKFMAAAESGGEVPWSLVWFPTVNDARTAADNGYLTPIDTSVVPVDKLVDGTYNEYGIEVGTFGMVLTWDESAYDSSPESMADLWDLDKYPGKRCFFNNPQYGWTLEAALLADGVEPDDLYPLDVDRALLKLDEIKDDIVWWTSGAQSIESFENGSCDIGILWANRAFTAKVENNFPMTISWSQGGYSNSVWAIPANAPNGVAAQELLKSVVTNIDGQIALATEVPTPIPAQTKGIEPNDFPEEVQPFLPVGSNVTDAILQDSEYYLENLDTVMDQFNRWVAQ